MSEVRLLRKLANEVLRERQSRLEAPLEGFRAFLADQRVRIVSLRQE